MMLRTHLLRRNEPALRDAFHGVLLRDAPAIAAGIRHYAMNAVIDQSHRMKTEPGPFKLDGITHMWFDGPENIERAESSAHYCRLAELLTPWLQSSVALNVTQRHFVWPLISGEGGEADRGERCRLLKRMAVLQRSQPLTAKSFQHIWEMEHGPRVAASAGELRGYIQNAVHACAVEQGEERLPPCDGLTELWFEDQEAMERVLPQSAPSSATDSAARIISNVLTFLVREVQFF